MGDRCVVLLASDCPATRIVYHALRAALPPDVRLETVLEPPVSRSTLLRRRMARLGVLRVLGQLLFVAGVVPLLRRAGRRRVEEIKAEHGLVDAPIPEPVHRVPSANAAEAGQLLHSLAPAVVVVSGTRILGRATLASTPAPFINMHAGITPAFRGVHGGYWALAEGRPDLVGTTVHRVDEGIDTGSVIGQATFAVTAADSFWTYPYLHTAAGVPILVRAVEAALAGEVRTRAADRSLTSTLRYHPTVWEYARARMRTGAR